MYILRNRIVKKEKRGCGVVRKVLKIVITTVVSSVLPLLNCAVDALPVELRLPRYRFCGPYTKLKEKLARGERGLYELDEACRKHKIAYAKYQDNESDV